MKKLLKIFSSAMLVMALFSNCVYKDPEENYGDIINDGKMRITSNAHPRLNGETNCFLCHQEFSIHQEDRIDGVNVNLEVINGMVRENGVEACSICHGVQ